MSNRDDKTTGGTDPAPGPASGPGPGVGRPVGADAEEGRSTRAGGADLRLREAGGRVGGMFDLDEERARTLDVGRIAHSVIAALAREGRRPDLARTKALVDRALGGYAPIEARAHRQNVVGIVHRYFTRFLPPRRFVFGGAEHDLGVGRVDLVWFDSAGRFLADEIKTGSGRSVRIASTLAQVDRYRRACISVWGERFVGLRLLCPTDPAVSMFIAPDGTTVPLVSTPYLERS